MRPALLVGLFLVGCGADGRPLDRPTVTPSGPIAPVTLGDATQVLPLEFTADDRWFVFLARTAPFVGELRAVDLATGAVRTLDRDVVVEPGVGDRRDPPTPQLAPRADGVLYRRLTAGEPLRSRQVASDLYFVRFDGEPTLLAREVATDRFRYADEGRWALHVDLQGTLRVTAVDTGATRVLAEGVVPRNEAHADLRTAVALQDLPLVEAESAVVATLADRTEVLRLRDGATLATLPVVELRSLRAVPDHVLALARAPDGAVTLIDHQLSTGAQTRSPSARQVTLRDDGRWAILTGEPAAGGTPRALYDVLGAETVALGTLWSDHATVRFAPGGDALVEDTHLDGVGLWRVAVPSGAVTLLDGDVISRSVIDGLTGTRVLYLRRAETGGTLVDADLAGGAEAIIDAAVVPHTVRALDGGRRLLWVRAGSDQRSLFTRRRDGGEVRSVGAGYAFPLPAGQAALVAHESAAGLIERLVMHRFDDGAERVLTDGPVEVELATDHFALVASGTFGRVLSVHALDEASEP
jgi:hypothetical protein